MTSKKKKTFNFGRIKVFILIGVLVYASFTFFNQQSILGSQAAKQAELLAKEEELNKEIEYYKNELDYIGSEDYIEQEARDRLGWVMPNETKFIEDEGATPSASADQSSDGASPSDPQPSPSVSPEPDSASPSP